MKYFKKTINRLAYTVLGITLVSAAPVNAASVEGLRLLDHIGEYKDELKVYFADKPSAVELRNLKTLGNRMGEAAGVEFLNNEPLIMSDTRTALIGAKDSSASFEMDTLTGNFLFNGGMQQYRQEYSTKNLPQNSSAVEFSRRWLEKYKLAVDPKEMTIAHVGGLNMGVSDGSGSSEIFEKLKTVRYSRMLDGLMVEGDTRIVVHLGESGDMAGVIYQWPKIGETAVLDPTMLRTAKVIRDQALKEIKAKSEKAEKAQLTRADLVIYDDGYGIAEPAYHFVVERYFDQGDLELVMIPYDFYIPTTKDPIAIYPYMETAKIRPELGKDKSKVKPIRNE